jgi:hypothetical protein
MKIKLTTIIFLVAMLLFTNCSKENKTIEPQNSESFKNFINEFKSFKLPLSFDIHGKDQLPYNIPANKSLTKKYLYDYVNIDNSGYISNVDHIAYICKLPDNNKNYVSVIYHIDYLNKNTQTIIANFSKKNETRISQLVLTGDNFRTYQLTSTIDKTGIITNKHINSTRFTWMPPFKKHPGYFFIFETITKYKIDENGEFIRLSYEDLGRSVAVKDGYKYIYPVEAPEKEFVICQQFDYQDPRVDTNSYSTPPKGYKLKK